MKYLNPTFSTPANSTAYRDNWEAVFGEERRQYLFLGDTHGDRHFIEKCARLAAEHDATIIQVGDWGYVWPGADQLAALLEILGNAGVSMRFIDGNHDDHPRLRAMPAVTPRAIYQARGSVYEDADGTRFLFCGGAPSIDWEHRVPGKSWWPDEEVISEAEFDRAMSVIGPVHVLVTHDAPDYPPGFAPKGDAEFRKQSARSMEMVAALIDRHQPELHVHGHWHHRYTRQSGNTKTVGLDCNHARLESATMLWSRAA